MMHPKMARPVLNLPRSPSEKLLEGIGLIGLLVCVGLFIYFWPKLPPTIPTHFDIQGRVNDWGSKSVFVIFPMMSAMMYFVMLIVSKFPHTFNYPWPITETNAAVQYRLARAMLSWVKACAIWLMAVLAWITAQTALTPNRPAIPNLFVLGFAAALIAGLILYFMRSWKAK